MVVYLCMDHYSPVHTRSFTPRYYEMDYHGEVTPTTILSLFEESSFSHLDCTGWDAYRLRQEGFGWILVQGGFSMARYPRYRESFSIETWVSACRLFYGFREFRIKNDEGEELGRADSLWVFYDLDKKKPTKIKQDILDAWRPDPRLELRRGGVPEGLQTPECLSDRTYDVRLSDIDTNGHVNNVNYLEWGLESVPLEVHRDYFLHRVEGAYLHEVTYGAKVHPACREVACDWNEERPDTKVFDLAVYRRSQKVSYARSAWKRREETEPGRVTRPSQAQG